MRKPLLIPLAFAFIFALVSGASGQGANYTANPNPELQNNGLAMPGRNSTTGPSATGNNATTDEDDPSLQRLSSKDSLGPGMLRDDGQLTAKVRRREKISHVESTKQLPTSGIDPKFQGSLLHSSVSSIEDVGDKAPVRANPNANASTGADADTGPKFENDPRFGGKHFVFTPMTADESKKKEAPRTQADSSPSPSPSPSASVSPSSH